MAEPFRREAVAKAGGAPRAGGRSVSIARKTVSTLLASMAGTGSFVTHERLLNRQVLCSRFLYQYYSGTGFCQQVKNRNMSEPTINTTHFLCQAISKEL